MEKRKDKKRNSTIKITIAVLTVMALIFSCCFGYALETANRYTAKTYIHSSVHSSDILCNGVDVSAYQNTLDWQKMKSQGIDFAIVRAGYTGSTTGKRNPDSMFENHMRGAKNAGLMLGVYYFSQATTVKEAVKEADYVIELIENAGYTVDDLALPVFMDYEKVSSSSGRINNLSKSTRTKCARAFLDEIALQGYVPGIYTDYSFGKNSVNGANLAKSYIYWGAQYNSTNDFAFVNNLWQYSSSGNVAGSSGRLDMDFWYINPVATAAPREEITEPVYIGEDGEDGEDGEEIVEEELIPVRKSLTEAECKITASSYTYDMGKAYTPKVTVRYGGVALMDGIDYRLEYVGNTQAGKAYARVRGIGAYGDYQMLPFNISPDTNMSAITVGKLSDRKYTGKVNKPTSVKVTDKNGNVLKSGIDYVISAPDSINVGTEKLKISFIGNYSGSKTVQYNIVKATPTITIKNAPAEIRSDAEDFNIAASVNFSEAKLKYSTSDSNIATISEDGTVHITGSGNVTVTVKSQVSSNLKAAESSFELFVKRVEQNITTAASKYTKNVTSGSFCLEAVTDGDGEISYEVEVVPEEVKEESKPEEEIPPEISEEKEIIPVDGEMPVAESDPAALDNMTEANEVLIEAAEAKEVKPVLRVTAGGRVIIQGPGKAIIHVKASQTAEFNAAEKLVTVVVKDMDSGKKQEKNAAIKKSVEKTTISSLKAVPAKKKVELKWTKSKAKYAVDFFQIYRSTKKSSGFKKIYETKTGKENSYVDNNGLKKGKTYYYKVRGVRYVDGKCVYTPFLKIQTATKK